MYFAKFAVAARKLLRRVEMNWSSVKNELETKTLRF